jgi:hypothetical protein
MGDFFTGATVNKTATGYSVVYKNQIVAEFAIRDLALMLALNRTKLESLVENSNVFLLKAA